MEAPLWVSFQQLVERMVATITGRLVKGKSLHASSKSKPNQPIYCFQCHRQKSTCRGEGVLAGCSSLFSSSGKIVFCTSQDQLWPSAFAWNSKGPFACPLHCHGRLDQRRLRSLRAADWHDHNHGQTWPKKITRSWHRRAVSTTLPLAKLWEALRRWWRLSFFPLLN